MKKLYVQLAALVLLCSCGKAEEEAAEAQVVGERHISRHPAAHIARLPTGS